MKKALVIIMLTAGLMTSCDSQIVSVETTQSAKDYTIIQNDISSQKQKSNPTASSSNAEATKLKEATAELLAESSEPVVTTPKIDIEIETTQSDAVDKSWSTMIHETTSSTEASPTASPPATTPELSSSPPETSEETIPSGSVPIMTAPKASVQETTESKVIEHESTKPEDTEPEVTVPVLTEPEITESEATVPETAESLAVEIDTYALEAYGRSYASNAYGYNGTSECTPGTGAGYFPAATQRIDSMDEGYSVVCQAIDSQYYRDCAYGYLPYEEINGTVVRCPINVQVSPTGEHNVFTITVYYGGTA